MNKDESCISSLFDLAHTEAASYLKNFSFPWEALKGIKEYIIQYGSTLDPEEYDHPEEYVWIHKTANVFKSAYIGSPCIIGKNTEVRHCAFIRGSAFIGRDCVIGNSTELKNVIIFDHVQVPHYNYVGDSILGYHSHMGAGSITSNVKSDKTDIVLRFSDTETATNMHKIGAFLGDYVEVGCGSVLNPGTIIGRRTNIYPLSSVRGCVPENSIYKKQGEVALKKPMTEV